MKKRYVAAVVFGAVLALMGCDCLTCGGRARRGPEYPVMPINAYSGQSKTALFNANGAPNQVETLGGNEEMWVYYTNYRPSGTGEMISYNTPSAGTSGMTCMVKVRLKDGYVTSVATSGC